MSGPVRVGIVGGGLAAQAIHLPQLAAMANEFTVVSVSDPATVVRERVAQDHAIPCAFEHWRQQLDGPDLDAVIVCAPNALHGPVVADALARGIHCLVEKPLCIAAEDATRLGVLADESGLVLQVGYMKRHDEIVEAVIDSLPSASALLRVDALTYDPGLRDFFTTPIHHGDVGCDARDELVAAEDEQVQRTVGTLDPVARRAFVDTFLGALIHDINLIAWFIDAHSGDNLHPTSSRWWHGGRAGTGAGNAGETTWSATWMLTPGVEQFSETIRLVFEDRVETLVLAAPYSDVKSFGTRRITVAGGQTTIAELPDRSFQRELQAFYDAIVLRRAVRNTAADAAADISVLTDLFRMTIPRGS